MARKPSAKSMPAPSKPARSKPVRSKPAPAKAAPLQARAPEAAPADHQDPRFLDVLDVFAADRALASVAEGYAASQMAGGRRKFGSRALKIDGKIFAMLSHGRFVVKLPAARVDAMVAAGDGEYFDPGHGRKMKQWLSLTSARPSWTALAREACAFVAATK